MKIIQIIVMGLSLGTILTPQKQTPINITINGSNGNSTNIDLSKLGYFANDAAAGAIDPATNKPFVQIKGYYLASEDNTLGVKMGTLLRREY